jgi:hypothetical protein
MPTGIALSVVTVLVMLATGLFTAAPDDFDVKTQIGANPVLPELRQFPMPPMHVAKVVGWKGGEAPTVPPGMTVTAMPAALSTLGRSTPCQMAMF